MVLYTDGLSEARRDSELFGFEGIRRMLNEYGRNDPSDLVGRLLQAASEWSGGHLVDDTAILIIERQS